MARSRQLALGMALLMALLAAPPAAAEQRRRAVVQEDGTLIVGGKTIRLWGVYLPDVGRNCRTNIRPMECGSEAVLALKFRLRSFVRCEPMERWRDGSVSAVCYVEPINSILDPDEDLAAYLLREGWAVALPDAPFEYAVLEDIARAQGRGMWSDRPRWRW